ncbi:MAG TPA: hypothetical protein DEF04_01020 [Clostridiales bacterium]|nr:hypothetical protein [Clostridiales bacterium]
MLLPISFRIFQSKSTDKEVSETIIHARAVLKFVHIEIIFSGIYMYGKTVKRKALCPACVRY